MIKNSKYLLSFTSSFIVTGLIALLMTVHPTYFIILLILPLLSLILYFLYRRNVYIKIVTYLIVIICGTIMWTSDFLRNYIIIDEYSIAAFVFFVINFVLTMIFPFIKPNAFSGIRIGMTLNYPKVWERTHKMASAFTAWTLLPLGLLFFFTNGLLRFTLCGLLVIMPLVLGAFYANLIGSPILKAEKEKAMNDLKEQIRREEYPKI